MQSLFLLTGLSKKSQLKLIIMSLTTQKISGTQKKLILASTSPYRKALLEKLGLVFESMAPLIDEEKEKSLISLPPLSPIQLAEKLAMLKAQSLASEDRVTIGGDQLVSFNGSIIGKPITFSKAVDTLMRLQGKQHELITSICICNGLNPPVLFTNRTYLQMRPLDQTQVERYIKLDQPFDCAGSYKIEKAGISLFHHIDTNDFTAIQGIPLMKLTELLHNCGYDIP